MAVEQTFAMIKPDAVAKNYLGKIAALMEDNDLTIVAARMLQLSEAKAKELYIEHIERPFFPSLLGFITSAPVMVLVLEGDDAIARYRKLMGATKPIDADEGTIRNLYADHFQEESVMMNAVHGSDSPESATREISVFFSSDEICNRS
ncbi:MAG: nucleoside-diphosphate kinase [Pseudomonadota bacterium]